jgi:arsenate reductase
VSCPPSSKEHHVNESDPLRILERQNTLAASQASLVEEFSGTFAPETVATCLEDSYERLLPASIAAYLPLLASRFARERLRAAARATNSDTARGRHAVGAGWAPLVLFVCTANSGRSQLAAALVAHRAGGRVEVASAGTAPAAVVQPEVPLVLGELGIDAGEMFPKPLTDEVVAGADVVVTMGCGDSCPVLPGRRYLDWGVADPAGRDLDAVRRIRDDIDDRVGVLLDELLVVPQP